MRSTSSIIYNVTGQTFEYRVPQGRPTSATFKVLFDYQGDDDTALFSGTATVDAVNTTIDATTGAGQTDPQKVNLTSTTGMYATKRYLISEGSRKEFLQPIEIVSADYIRARFPLRSTYTTAATLVSTYLSAAVDATFIANPAYISEQIDPNPSYRVRWEILVGGVTTVAYSYFDVVRAPVAHEVDIDDVNARAPGLVDSLPIEYQIEQGRPLIDAAWAAVQAKLAVHGVDVDAFRNDQVLDELMILMSLNILANGGWKPMTYDLSAYVADTERNFETFLQQAVTVTTKPRMAVGQTGAAERVVAQPIWSK